MGGMAIEGPGRPGIDGMAGIPGIPGIPGKGGGPERGGIDPEDAGKGGSWRPPGSGWGGGVCARAGGGGGGIGGRLGSNGSLSAMVFSCYAPTWVLKLSTHWRIWGSGLIVNICS